MSPTIPGKNCEAMNEDICRVSSLLLWIGVKSDLQWLPKMLNILADVVPLLHFAL